MTHDPDMWVILKINTKEKTLYKVFASWYSSYLSGEYWRLNSGITEIIDNGEHWIFEGFSGSSYRCNKKCEGVAGSYSQSILDQAIERVSNGDTAIEVIPFYTFKEEFNEVL